MEFNFCYFPEVAFHASGSHGQDISVIKLDAVTQINALLGYG